MRLTLAWRFGLVLSFIGVAASGLTGYYAYHASRELLIKAAEERLLTATRVLVRQVAVSLEVAAADVSLMSEHPQAARLLLRSQPQQQEFSERNVALLFQRMLETRRSYFQMRLIDAAAHGIERIRVDRDEAGVVRVEGDDLQEKGHTPYVFETLRLAQGQTFVSRASINHEIGAHAGQGKPALQVAAPVYGVSDSALGLVVLNVDLEGLFAQLAADLPPGLALYLTNGEGDYLIHPDRRRAFAFDRGQRDLAQDDFPDMSRLLVNQQNRDESLVMTNVSRAGDVNARVAAFVRQSLPGLQAEEEFILGLSQPLAAVLAESDQLGVAILRIVIGFSALAIMLAALLARALSRPLNQIVTAVKAFAGGEATTTLPLNREDEIGLLARSVDHMQAQIQAQLANLHRHQDELDHLASHDSLTGLPNRRLFLDRLDQALARAKRNDGQLALLFIDLDDFKIINDTHGHAAGDAVLCAVAQRLRLQVREADTVARLGGDEFILLLDGIDEDAATQHVAEKVLAALAQPIPYRGVMLACKGSVGISHYPQDGTLAASLIAVADQAMYQAKPAGHR